MKKGWYESGNKNLKRQYNFIKALYPSCREKNKKLIQLFTIAGNQIRSKIR